MPNIIGLSAYYHESACCLLQNGKLIAAAAEERFTRIKHDLRIPVHAFRYCLDSAGLSPAGIDCLAYYEDPATKHDRQLWMQAQGGPPPSWPDPAIALESLRERLGYDGPIRVYPHHLAHAASAFFFSGFDEAAILTVDGVGEWATTTYGHGRGADITLFEEVRFPHSLGLFYAAVTAYLGFRVNGGEGKVMGLAPYGRPGYVAHLQQLVTSDPAGQFRLNLDYFDFISGRRMFSDALSELLGQPARRPGEPPTVFHQDVAHSLQIVLEEILLEKVRYLAGRVDSPNLCLAGGVALNCVANGRIHREGPFKNLFVQPAAGDAGTCLGAAALAHRDLTGRRHSHDPLAHVYLGPEFSNDEIRYLLDATGCEYGDYTGREGELVEKIVDLLVENQVIGWFQGKMEFGPRALGARSILANPQEPTMQDRVNRLVKQREPFRPFAPAVLAEHLSAHFQIDNPHNLTMPFMLETTQVQSPLPLPAVTHIDGSARPQAVSRETNPRFFALLESFYWRTGCPMLLNTSLNRRGEPIACNPVDALFLLGRSDLDALVLGEFILHRSALPDHWPQLLPDWQTQATPAFHSRLESELYTFV